LPFLQVMKIRLLTVEIHCAARQVNGNVDSGCFTASGEP